jgi:hypothetical protein
MDVYNFCICYLLLLPEGSILKSLRKYRDGDTEARLLRQRKLKYQALHIEVCKRLCQEQTEVGKVRGFGLAFRNER